MKQATARKLFFRAVIKQKKQAMKKAMDEIECDGGERKAIEGIVEAVDDPRTFVHEVINGDRTKEDVERERERSKAIADQPWRRDSEQAYEQVYVDFCDYVLDKWKKMIT